MLITVSTILTFRSHSNYFGAVRRSLGTLHMPQCIYYEQTSSLITKEIGNPKIFENGNFSTKFVLDGSLQPKGLENHFEMYLNICSFTLLVCGYGSSICTIAISRIIYRDKINRIRMHDGIRYAWCKYGTELHWKFQPIQSYLHHS